MSSNDVRPFMLSDEAIRRALRPAADVVAPVGLVGRVARAIATNPRQSRWPHMPQARSRTFYLLGQLLLVLALLLALIIGAIIVGSLRERPTGGGPVFVAQGNELSAIDLQTNRLTPIVVEADGIFGVARSTSGEYVSFWTGPGPNNLVVMHADGTDRHQVARNLEAQATYAGGIDVWSSDDRFIASGVWVNGVQRILVVDVSSGEGLVIGPGDSADSPIWSPDSDWVAFAHETAAQRTIAVMRRDGSQIRDVTAGLDAHVSGPDNWSSDGTWIYFDARHQALQTSSVYRVDVQTARVEQLTHGPAAAAPALSPDDRTIAFIQFTFDGNDTLQAVFVMGADGSGPHLLADRADTRGWSSDGHYVLVVEKVLGQPVELLAITPDGAERRVLLSLDSCPDPCLTNISWGWPRP